MRPGQAVLVGVMALCAGTAAFEQADPKALHLDMKRLATARDYALRGGGSGKVIFRGRDVFRWGDQKRRYDVKSASKSIGVTALGLAIADGRAALSDRAVRFDPTFAIPPEVNRGNPWRRQIMLFHLATQTAGFEKPGGYTRLLFAPGSQWNYSDGGPNWLADCLTRLYKQDLQELLFERVFAPIGITRSDLQWRPNAYRPRTIDGVPRREFGSGVHANVEALARIGVLYLRKGRWGTRQLLPASFVEQATHTPEAIRGLPVMHPQQYGDASNHYGLLWWNNNDGTLADVPRDAFWAWGLYDSLILVVPSLDLVAVRTGDRGVSWKRRPGAHPYAVLAGFFVPLVEAARAAGTRPDDAPGPYPPSPVIAQIRWAPPETIARKACGSDNWPMTWGDDDALYTAYGDGWGFKPKVDRKLSLGLAKILGPPEDFHGVNIRSASAEQIGQGPAGKKASGLLMVDGVLYMWARNAGNAQLAWSDDHGATWQWAPWRFTESFGCPTFLNFGRNYAGARDGYVYVYSPDSDSAYKPADTMVLARVPQSHLRERRAFEFWAGDDPAASAWTADIRRRHPVFVHPGRCYRSSICYIAPLRRYLWWQVLPGNPSDDLRQAGGFGIYDAPEPWGPWTTAFFTRHWDVGPGESATIPTKWVASDGRSFWLVFSGNDCFSVRKADLILAGNR